MCDCFHLAFPNWHGSPGTGAGRRLRAPEPGGEDDSICEEPSQFIEGERPRPQGSSPVEEYPEEVDADRKGDGGLHDTPHKKGRKKGKRVGFGSLFDKRSTPKMNKLEEVHSPPGTIVKTAKEACAEGLVVSGGGKEGIFIKEVRPESPASKNLSVKEGDQILSATVYFEDVSYEDALHILEHAQPYKVELLLKRKPAEAAALEDEAAVQSEDSNMAEHSSPEMRGGKTKKHGDGRISWPKFPSFGKGRKFKRSHSSSEADEQRKLELSPTTSDTESPIKTQEAVKAKTKKHKIKLFRSRVSSSVDQADKGAEIGEGVEIHAGTSDVHSPEVLESTSGETPQVYAITDPEQTLTGSGTKHKVDLISLDTTLKTTDVTAVIADQGSPPVKISPEGKKKKKKKERSELKLRIMGKEKSSSQKNKSTSKQEVPVQSSPQRLRTPGGNAAASESLLDVMVSHSVVSHTEVEGNQVPVDIDAEVINNTSSDKTLAPLPTVTADVEMSMPKVDLSLDMSEVGLLRKSPQICKEKIPKEETYGIRTRGPLAEMGSTKPRMSENDNKVGLEPKTKDTKTEIHVSNLLTETKIGDVLVDIGTRHTPAFKLPQVDLDAITDQLITTTDAKGLTIEVKSLKDETQDDQLSRDKLFKTHLPKREDIEIPGMEDALSTMTKPQAIKQPKTVFTDSTEEIQAETVQMAIDVDRVKEAVSKLPGFKLPKVDISGLSVHQEISKTDVNVENREVTRLDTVKEDREPFTVTNIHDMKPTKGIGIIIQREDWEIPGMPHTELRKEHKLDSEKPTTLSEEGMVMPDTEASDNKSKKGKKSIPGFGISKPDIRFPETGIGLPMRDISMHKEDEAKDELIGEQERKFKLPSFGISLSTIPGTEGDVDAEKSHLDAFIPEGNLEKMEVKEPEVKIKALESDTNSRDAEEQSSMFKLPTFGMSLGRGIEPEIVTEKDVNVTLPKFPGMEPKEPSLEVELGKDAKKTETDGGVLKADMDVTLPDAKIEVQLPKISLPSFGSSKADIKEPEVDVSVPEMDISLPGGTVVSKDPEVEMKGPDSQIELKGASGSPKKFKMPKLKFPQFGAATKEVNAEVPDVDTNIDLKISSEKPAVEIPSIEGTVDVDIKSKEVELEGQDSKFKLPKFGITLPKVKGSEIDVDISKPNIDLPLPGEKAEVKLTDVGVKEPLVDAAVPEVAAPDVDRKVKRKFSFPKFGSSRQAPEIDASLPAVDISLSEEKMKVEEPEVEVKIPERKVDVKGSPTKFKMPSIKLPTFGMDAPSATMEIPDVKKDINIDEGDKPDSKLRMSLEGPAVDIQELSVDIKGSSDIDKSKGVELKEGSRFKMPTLGISLPKVKVPEMALPEVRADIKLPDVDANSEGTLKDVDIKLEKQKIIPEFGLSKLEVTAPEIDDSLPVGDISVREGKMEVKELEVEVKVPESKVDVKGSPTKFKMPTIKFPKFGLDAPSVTVEIPDVKKDIDIEDGDKKNENEVDVKVSTTKVAEVAAPDVDLKVKRKFSFPKFGSSKPDVKAPEIDASIPVVDVALPEGKMKIEETEVEVKIPESKVEGKGSPTKFKMPSLKFPKFGLDAPSVSVELPDVKKDNNIDGVDIPDTKLTMSVEGPAVDIEKPKFSKPDVTAPDVSLPAVDISLPEGKMEVKEPEVEVKIPEGKGSPTKFKMPTIKFPKFGLDAKSVTVDAPDVKKVINIDGSDMPDTQLSMSLEQPAVEIDKRKLDIKGPSMDFSLKSKGVESEGKGRSSKTPDLGMSLPKVKGEGMAVGLQVSKTDINVTLPEVRAEVQLPDVEVKDLSGSSSKPKGRRKDLDVKLKSQKIFPEIELSKPDVKAPAIDASLPEMDIYLPDGMIKTKEPKIEVKGSPTKFKMPTKKFPKFGLDAPSLTVELPDVKKDVSIDIPDSKLIMSVQAPAVEIEKPEFDIKAPSVDIDMKDKGVELEGKGSKFKMPDLGLSLPKIKGTEMALPEMRAEVRLPDVEVKNLVGGVSIPERTLDAKMESEKIFPEIGLSKPDVKAPEFDASLPEMDISLPAGKIETKEPKIDVKGSPTKFKMPTIKFPKFELDAPSITVDLPDVKKDVSIDGIDIPDTKLTMSVQAPAVEIEKTVVDIKAPSVDIDMKDKGVELEGKGSMFKMPDLGLSLPKIKGTEMALPGVRAEVRLPDAEVNNLTGGASIPEGAIDVKSKKQKIVPGYGMSKPDVKAPEIAVSLPEGRLSLRKGKMEVKEPEVEVKIADSKIDVKGSPTKFKMPTIKFPKFGLDAPSVTMEAYDVKKDVTSDEVDMPDTMLTVSVKGSAVEGIEPEGQKSGFKLPSFGISLPKVKGSEIGVNMSNTDMDVTLPEGKAEIQLPDIKPKELPGGVAMPETTAPDVDTKVKKGKISFPSFGFSKTDVKQPEVDVGVPEMDISLPGGTIVSKELEVEMKGPASQIEVKGVTGSPTKFKMPSLKFPTFGAATPTVTTEIPAAETSVNIDVSGGPNLKPSAEKPAVEGSTLDIDMKNKEVEIESQASKFKVPKFGITLPKVKGPEIDLNVSKPNIDVMLPEVKADVTLPDVDVNKPSIGIAVPEVSLDADVKVKQKFSFPKFGSSKSDIKAPEIDVSLPKGDISLLEEKMDVKEPGMEVKMPEGKVDVKGSPTKFKMPTLKFPKFGAATPTVSVEVPDVKTEVNIDGTSVSGKPIQISTDKPEVDIHEPCIDIEGPTIDVDMKSKGVQIEGQGSMFKLPKFGITLPKVKVPDVDVNVPETNIDVTSPEAKAEVKLPDVDVKGPSVDAAVPEIAAPDVDLKVKRKFTFPKFGFSKPDVKAPEVDVTLPEGDMPLLEGKVKVKETGVEVKIPQSEVEVEGSPTKFKMPTMKFPKFGLDAPSVTVEQPNVKEDINIDGVDIPDSKLTMSVEAPAIEIEKTDVDIKAPSVDIDMKSRKVEHEGQGSRFKMPSFGFSLSKAKGTDVDVNVSKTDVDVTLPGAKADVQEPSGDVAMPEAALPDVKSNKPRMSFPRFGFSKPDVKAPEVDVSHPEVDISLPEGKVVIKEPEVEIRGPDNQLEVKDVVGSPTKFKMPTLKFPKFGVATPTVTVEVPEVEKEVNIDGSNLSEPDLKISFGKPDVDIHKPSIGIEGPTMDVDMKPKGVELEGQGSKFRLPKFGITLPKVKGPEIDVNMSKPNVDVTLPEAKLEVTLPDVDIKEASVSIAVPEVAAPDVDVKVTKGRFSFPKFGFSKPDIKAPEADVSLPAVDISLPEGKMEIKAPGVDVELPESEVDVKGSPAKFTIPTMESPKFGSDAPSVTVGQPSVKGIDIDQVDIPDSTLTMSVEGPAIDIEGPSIDLDLERKGVEFEVKAHSGDVAVPELTAPDVDVKVSKGRFSFPKFGFSKPDIKAHEIDASVPEMDVSLPEGKVALKVPEVEMKGQDSQVEVKDAGSTTKFRMPTLKFPKFGAATPNATVPDVEKDFETEVVSGPSLKTSMEKPEVDIEEPTIDIEGPKFGITLPKVKGPDIDVNVPVTNIDVASPEVKAEVQLPDVDVKQPSLDVAVPELTAPKVDVKVSKGRFSFPKFGFSKPDIKAHEIDASVPEMDVSLPEGKVAIKVPDVAIKAPESQIEVEDVGSTTKFKMPTLKFPKFGAATPTVAVEVPDVETSINIDGTTISGPNLKTSSEKMAVEIHEPSIDIEGPIVDVEMPSKGVELEGQGSKFRLPRFGITLPKVKGPEIDVNVSKPNIDVELPEAEVQLPDVGVKQPTGGVAVPEVAAPDVDLKESKQRFSFPKFGFSKPDIKANEVNVGVPEVDISLPEGKVVIKEPEMAMKGPDSQIEVVSSPTKFKMPTLKFPKFGAATDVETSATLPEIKAEVKLPNVEVKDVSRDVSIPEGTQNIDPKESKQRFSFPKFGFSKSDNTTLAVDTSLPEVDISLPEGQMGIDEPIESQVQIKDPVGSTSRFKIKFPKFGASTLPLPEADVKDVKASEVDVNVPHVDISVPEGKIEVKAPDVEVKSLEGHAEVKDVSSSTRFKMPTIKFPTFGSAAPNVTVVPPDVETNIKAETEEETDVERQTVMKSEPSKQETDSSAHGSPSKFKLPTFKMAKLTTSKSKPEDELDREAESKTQVQVKLQEPDKSTTLTSFGEMLKGFEVEFDVPSIDEEKIATSKVETPTKETTAPTPEKVSWFKFPKFGKTTSPEPAKMIENESEDQMSDRSPSGVPREEDLSTASSVRSSDAFADISSAVTSEQVGLSSSSPTKVTVKYSDPDATLGHGEIHSDVITSTARTELISLEPHLPEKITIPMSSGVSSSSVDTLKSADIHVVTSNIQAIPQSLQAAQLTDFQVHSAFKDDHKTQSGERIVIERHIVRDASGNDRETVRRVTHVLGVDSSEPISDETATSIKRLKDTVHSEKMKFFDGDE